MNSGLRNVLGTTSFWIVNKAITRVVGINASLLLSELITQDGYNQPIDGWITYSREEAIENLCLSRHEQRAAIKKLVASGMINEESRGMPKRGWYKINYEVVEEVLSHTQLLKKRQLDVKKNASSCPKNDMDVDHTCTPEPLKIKKSSSLQLSKKTHSVVQKTPTGCQKNANKLLKKSTSSCSKSEPLVVQKVNHLLSKKSTTVSYINNINNNSLNNVFFEIEDENEIFGKEQNQKESAEIAHCILNPSTSSKKGDVAKAYKSPTNKEFEQLWREFHTHNDIFANNRSDKKTCLKLWEAITKSGIDNELLCRKAAEYNLSLTDIQYRSGLQVALRGSFWERDFLPLRASPAKPSINPALAEALAYKFNEVMGKINET